MTEALFEKVEVLAVQSVTIHPTPEADAHGWSDAFGPVPLLLDAGRAFGTDGRGERTRTSDLGEAPSHGAISRSDTDAPRWRPYWRATGLIG